MPILAAPDFLGILQQKALLEPAQLEELCNSPGAKSGDTQGIGKFLLQKGWLTKFQVTALANGRDIDLGPYRLLQLLGEGGMGQVYKAQHVKMQRIVALKVIRKERLNNPEFVKRFQREIQLAAKLVHPNIVIAYDANQVGDSHYFVMEYVDGTDLARMVKASGPLPVAQACEFVRQAACGLAHAHDQGLVHRDIKPSNLLVSKAHGPQSVGTVKILDMGLARSQLGAEVDTSLTQEGAVVGTPDYLAPEQAVDSRAVDARCDIYSLGCTLFYLLAGEPPYKGKTMAELLLKHQLGECPPIQSKRPDVPAEVANLIRKSIAKDPNQRFGSCNEMALALAPHCQGAGSTAMVPAPGSGSETVKATFSVQLVNDTPAPSTKSGDKGKPAPSGRGNIKGNTKVKAASPAPGASRKSWLLAGLLGGMWIAGAGAAGFVFLQNRQNSPTQPIADAGPRDPSSAPQTGTAPETKLAAETKPEVKDTRPVVKSLTLAPLAALSLKPGEAGTLDVKIERQGFTGAVSVIIANLPPEVSAQPLTIEAGSDTGQLKLQALPGAAEMNRKLEIVAAADLLVAKGEAALSVAKPAAMVVKPPELLPPPTPKPPDPTPPTPKPPEPLTMPAKPPLPSKEKLAEASKQIRELYKVDFAKKLPADRLALAQKLITKGRQTKDDAVGRFALYTEAMELAAEGNDTATVLAAIDLLEPDYAVDVAELKVKTLTTMSKQASTPTPLRALADAALLGIDDALETENFDAAGKLFALADAALKKSSTPALTARLESRRLELPEYRKDYDAYKAASAQLAKTPDDPDAALVIGRYRCFRRAEWAKGLPLLAMASDPAIQALAKKDLANTTMAAAQVEVGDGWWDLGEPDTTGIKLNLFKRAGYWYQQAETNITAGLTRDRLEKRLKTVQEMIGFTRPPDAAAGFRRLDGHKGKVTGVVFLSDSQRMLTAGQDQTIRLWDLKTGKSTASFPSTSAAITDMAIAPNGKRMLTAVVGAIQVWDVEGRRSLAAQNAGTITGAAFAGTEGGRIVYANATAGQVYSWNYEAVGGFIALNAPNTKIVSTSVGASLDGRLAFVGTKDGMIHSFALEPPKQLGTIRGHTGEVIALAVSRDGRMLVSAGADKTVRIWDVTTASELRRLRGFTGTVTALALTPDGRRLLTGGDDKTVRVWDPRNGQEIRRFTGHTDKVLCVAFSPDGNYAISGSADQTARVWQVVAGK